MAMKGIHAEHNGKCPFSRILRCCSHSCPIMTSIYAGCSLYAVSKRQVWALFVNIHFLTGKKTIIYAAQFNLHPLQRKLYFLPRNVLTRLHFMVLTQWALVENSSEQVQWGVQTRAKRLQRCNAGKNVCIHDLHAE